MTPHTRVREERAERLPIRVHDIIIRGNTRTKDTAIESEVEELLRSATTFQELRHAAALAEERLRALDIFESVDVRVDACPPELPGTANVVVEVSEPSNPFAENLRSFAKSAGDIWDASGYGLGEFLSRYGTFRIPLSGRMSFLASIPLSLTLGILSSVNHDLSYNITWSRVSGPAPQPGYNLLSVLCYSIKIDHRDSALRPTKGFEILSTTRIGVLYPKPLHLRFIRQKVELRHAIPLGFYGAALNLGVSAGVEFSCLAVRRLWAMGRGHVEPRVRDNGAVVYVGWDLPIGASADLSFDLPLKVLRDAGIYGHVSAKTGCLFRGFSLQRLRGSFQHLVAVGVMIPTDLFRMEVNYCHNFQLGGHDQGNTGIVFEFSSRW